MPFPDSNGDSEVASDAVNKLTETTRKVLSLDFKNSDIKTRRNALDQRVSDLEKNISALKNYQNSLTPVCRLPQELLANIFLVVASLVRAGANSSTHRTWARVTQVCRYWRAVALDCRELWSTITFQKYEFTDLCLNRSKDFPLTVVIRTLPSEDYRKRGQWGIKIKSILSKAEDIFHLDVKGDRSSAWNHESRTDLKTVFSYLQGTPKKLQKLTLDCTDCYGDILPKEFLEEGAPALKHISFTRTEFKWVVPQLHALTHLHITEKEGVYAVRPDLDSFLTGLRKMPHLQILELIDALPRHILESAKTISESPLVEISSSLRALKLTSEAKEIKQFFNLTQVPRLAWIEIKFSDTYQVPASQVDECLEALSRSWKVGGEESHGANLNSLSIVDIHKASKCPRFELLFVQPPTDLPEIPHPVVFHGPRVVIEFAHSTVPIHAIFKSIGKHFGLHTVQYFTVENTWSLPSVTYAEMLEAMPSLAVINLRKTWMKFLLDAMMADPAFQHPLEPLNCADKPKPYCPGLAVLHFHLTDFNEYDEENPQTLRKILDLFEKRARDYCLRQLFISVATNFDHPDGMAVTQCFQKIAMPGMEYRWDGSVHMRKPAPPVMEVTDEETDEDDYESESAEEEESEEEEEYECTASDLECF